MGFTLRNSKSKANAAAVKVAGGRQMPLIARNIIGNLHGIRLQGNVMPLVINNTIVGNSGDSLCLRGTISAKIMNNIVTFNQGPGTLTKGRAVYSLSRNDIYGNSGGNYINTESGKGGISLDPRFSDGYQLATESPCIGTGQSLDGEPVDMGAYGGSTAQLINTAATAMLADTDQDGIDDAWEMLFFGNLTTANSTSDYDRDGYSDVQEYLNNLHRHVDPDGTAFDLSAANEPGGEGYKVVEKENMINRALGTILNFLLSREKESETVQP
ncbi:MAG: right-handed parallel beta-helix repeat-containing protein [Candidatus Electrothrix sp. GM3_4]|nr:right-handed parallel beta-helix repeat-containing protein [Candidatus Electrothrix sp. GM3_4]